MVNYLETTKKKRKKCDSTIQKARMRVYALTRGGSYVCNR